MADHSCRYGAIGRLSRPMEGDGMSAPSSSEPLSSGAAQRESTAGLGYRQKKLLAALRDFGRPMPTGYLVRVLFDTDVLNQVSYKTTSVALNGLEKRELARRVRRGLWEAA